MMEQDETTATEPEREAVDSLSASVSLGKEERTPEETKREISCPEDQSQPIASSTVRTAQNPELRLRGNLVDSSAGTSPSTGDAGSGDNLFNRPWPKDVNTPLKRLAGSSTTTQATTASTSLGPCSCFSWSRRRIQVASLGCTSSVIVLTARLILDSDPSAYVIHSVIVFLDMILIHLFTYSPWLSVSGEMVTILFFLSFHYTNEKVFELMETTLIAALCSMHMIFSRNKHMDHEQKLEESLKIWHQLSLRSNPAGSSLALSGHDHRASILRATSSSHHQQQQQQQYMEGLLNNNNNNNSDNNGQQSSSPPTITVVNSDDDGDIESHTTLEIAAATSAMPPPLSLHHSQNRQFVPDEQEEPSSSFLKTCGEHFFEHFLDGSAGVMYTSFVGLIVDDLIHYGETTKCR